MKKILLTLSLLGLVGYAIANCKCGDDKDKKCCKSKKEKKACCKKDAKSCSKEGKSEESKTTEEKK